MTEPCPEFAIINDENILICKNGKTNYWLMNMEIILHCKEHI